MFGRAASRGTLLVFLQATFVAGTVAPVAHAQSQDDLDRARNLFRQGLSLEAAANWAAALGKFQDVARVKLTPQVRFHIARWYRAFGFCFRTRYGRVPSRRRFISCAWDLTSA
jgi:hypothetical protein